ncbi:MAG: head GIN domain-containing protein [Methanomicrobiales archaeon]
MKKSILGIIGIIMIVTLASGCIGTGSGNVVKEDRKLSGFNQITLNGDINLILKQGDNESVVVEAEDNIVSEIKTEVSNNKLTISHNAPTAILPTKPINVYVTVKDINSIDVSGSGKVEGSNINANNLDLTISGSGNTKLNNITAKNIKSVISGSGKIELSGVTESQNIKIEGSGTYNSRNLQSDDTVITIDGSGQTTVNTSDNLQITITGSGKVSYLGDPTIKQTINGNGEINKIT